MSKIAITPHALGSGTLTIQAPNTNTDRTLNLPDAGGDIVTTASHPSVNMPLTLGTAVSASGTALDFTGIPSWAKRITVMFKDVSFAAAGSFRIRIGNGTVETSGYFTILSILGTGVATSAITDGIAAGSTSAGGDVVSGQCILTNINGNSWTATASFGRTGPNTNLTSGSITLPSVLNTLSVVATSSTFDAGTINIMYEG